MADVWLKLRMLLLYKLNLRMWLADVWSKDADERICCDGHMCGCYGACHNEYWHRLLGDE